MAYPGNPELSAQAQERVMSAFRQVVRKLQDGQREEALIGLEFVLRLDPAFRPGLNLQHQLSSGAAEIDLSSIITDLQAPTTDAIEGLLVEAVEDFEMRHFLEAKERVEKVLLELPGHPDARHLLEQITQALKVETQVGQFLTQAREALDHGDPQEAANFVMMAQALDPHHAGIESTLQDIYAASGASPSRPADPATTMPTSTADSFLLDEPSPGNAFAVSFEEPVAAGGPPGFASAAPAETIERGSGPSGFGSPTEDFAFDPSPVGGGAPDTSEDWSGFASSDFSFGAEAVPEDSASGSLDADDSDLFTESTADVADLFDVESEVGSLDEVDSSPAADDRPEIVRALREGDAAFEDQSFLEALHRWSFGLLTDPGAIELKDRIAGARITLGELRQQLQQTLESARSMAESGDRARALELVSEVLAVEPGHVGAAVLRERLELPLAAPVAPPVEPTSPPPTLSSLPGLDDDLFSEELGVPAAGGDELLEELAVPSSPAAREAVARRRPPWIILAGGVTALLVVLAGVWAGIKILGSGETDLEADPAAINQVLQESQALFDQRRIEEAIQLLQNFPVTGLQRERLERRIETYQAALAPPTPTPIPEGVTRGQQLLDEGRFLAAFEVVTQSLAAAPQDPGLLELRERIVTVEPLVRPLYNALAAGNYRAAVGAADAYLDRHPATPDGREALERSLFNAGLSELRSYNLTGAEVHLRRLSGIRPDDVEVRRILEFIDRYKASPVDMQFQTFTRSLSDR